MNISGGAKINPLPFSFSSLSVHKENGDKLVKRDSIMISDEARQQLGKFQSRYSSMRETLMEKRQQVQEMKSNLRERTLEEGEDLSTIKEQLAAFDEQIVEIDEQMTALEAQRREQEQREKEEQQAAAKPKEDAEAAQLTSLLQSVQSLENVNALKQVKVPLENAHRRLKIEMENDLGRGTFVESKQKKINELAGRIRNIEGAMNNQIRKAKDSSNEMTVKEVTKEATNEENAKIEHDEE